jgi:hypothetical protein
MGTKSEGAIKVTTLVMLGAMTMPTKIKII